MSAVRDIAVIVGSLRKESVNRKVAHALAELAPPDRGWGKPHQAIAEAGGHVVIQVSGPLVTAYIEHEAGD
jgi:hypothetical protein